MSRGISKWVEAVLSSRLQLSENTLCGSLCPLRLTGFFKELLSRHLPFASWDAITIMPQNFRKARMWCQFDIT